MRHVGWGHMVRHLERQLRVWPLFCRHPELLKISDRNVTVTAEPLGSTVQKLNHLLIELGKSPSST